jgi:hypothetical protein
MKARSHLAAALVGGPVLLLGGSLSADFVGMVVEADSTGLDGVTPLSQVPGYNGQRVYNVFVVCNEPTDQVTGIVGSPGLPFSVSVLSGARFVNSPNGHDTPPSALETTFLPSLNWDSFYTIGVKYSNQFSTPLIIAPGTPGPNTEPWPPTPNTNMAWTLPPTLPGGATTPETVAGNYPGNRVLVMRLVTQGDEQLQGNCGVFVKSGSPQPQSHAGLFFGPFCDGVPPDCNGNGVSDFCDLDDGTSMDCDGNGFPDECGANLPFVRESPPLSPFGDGFPASFTVLDPPHGLYTTNVTLTFTAVADLGPGKSVTIDLDGTVLGSELSTAQACPGTPSVDTRVFQPHAWNQAAADGAVTITMTPVGGVDPAACDPASYITVRVAYVGTDTGPDCNSNGLPDWYDLQGASDDCDGNNVPDECDEDCNRNGVADACDISGGASADCNGNGVPDECDVTAQLIESSGPMNPVLPLGFTVVRPPPAAGAVRLTFGAYDTLLGSPCNQVDVALNGSGIGSVFRYGEHVCDPVAESAVIELPAAQYNALVGGGDALITLSTTAGPDLGCGPDSAISVGLAYPLASPSEQDSDGDGVPDACQCPADVAPEPTDGLVDVQDLVAVILAWSEPGGPADVNGDGNVDVEDLVMVILAWGPCT